jgi:hypothetical protein|tara:strand:+ start:318 stop:551 length:234 start_codon:yes stop_codon:yes gene_type:complete
MTSQYVPKLTADERKRVEENFEIPLEQFEDELKKEWDRGIGIGIKTGHLSRRADGAIVGKSNPLDWFDAVEARRKET